ncbi:MAG: GSU2403 family nucleotidyltransferase fold protein [bacterium]|nr:GSU2403 family nucleotidyltransferase fold protein [bacterium]
MKNSLKENSYRIFDAVIKRLHSEGVLNNMILIGGWCLYLYRIHYKNPPEIIALRTSDIDLLIPRKIQLANNCDLAYILKILGFEIIYGPEGHIKFSREDFDVEFLTPEIGAGSAKPYEFKQLNLNAQQLRYLTILQDNVITINYRGIPVKMPNVQSFIIHKMLVVDKRKPAKRTKDIEKVKALLDFILTKPKLFYDFKVYYTKLFRPWQKQLLANAKRYLPDLYKMLTVI